MASGNALLTLERMLNGRTTLKTQKVTHRNIVCIGTELLNEIQQVMREDREKAVNEAVAVAEEKARQELNRSLQELREQMIEEREQALEESRLRAEEKMADIQYRCEVAEKKRARSAWEMQQAEKREALERAAEEAEMEKQEAVRTATNNLTKKLRNEAALERELVVARALAVARKNAEKRQKESVEETRHDCENRAKTEAAKVAKIHQDRLKELNQRISHLQALLKAEQNAKYILEGRFQDMKEDYKRFQDYTRGFHSDYLMKK